MGMVISGVFFEELGDFGDFRDFEECGDFGGLGEGRRRTRA